MLNKKMLLVQLKKDIEKIKDNDAKKTFYTVLYNIIKRSLDDNVTIYSSDYIL